MAQTKIIDVKVNEITVVEVLKKIKSFLSSDKQHYIITLNPEMVVETQKNNYFKNIINEADLVVPDGIGIIFANKFLNQKALPEKITGIDLIYKICEDDFIKDKRIYLLGAGKGIAKKTAKVLSEKYNYLNIVGAEEGIPVEIFNFQFSIFKYCFNFISRFSDLTNLKILRQIIKRFKKICDYKRKVQKQIQDSNQTHILQNDLIQRINKAQPNILFVAFGSPKQEEWIYENLKKIASVKLAMGVGGSFDFISGKKKRACFIFQKLELEWLWRLILEPQRIKRIYNATIKFGWIVLKNSNRFHLLLLFLFINAII